jgi:3-mercaptopyruvate sulfurtransferase SseA
MRLRDRRASSAFSPERCLLLVAGVTMLAGAVACQHGASGGHRGSGRPAILDATTAVNELDDDWVLLDARARSECEAGHAAGAVCLPLEALTPHPPGMLGRGARTRLGRHMAQAGADWNTPILVIGGSGWPGLKRAASACWLTSLVETGPCHVLEGGHEAWEAAGGSVASGPGRRADASRNAPLHVPSVPLTWAGEEALRHATIEPDVAIVQVASPEPQPRVPGAYELAAERMVPSGDAPDTRGMLQRLADKGLLAEEQIVVLGAGLEDGALGWFLLDRVAELPEVRLYPGGLARYRGHAHLPLEDVEKAREKAPSEGGTQLDDREVGG